MVGGPYLVVGGPHLVVVGPYLVSKYHRYGQEQHSPG